jgi:hypothetical protein
MRLRAWSRYGPSPFTFQPDELVIVYRGGHKLTIQMSEVRVGDVSATSSREPDSGCQEMRAITRIEVV